MTRNKLTLAMAHDAAVRVRRGYRSGFLAGAVVLVATEAIGLIVYLTMFGL